MAISRKKSSLLTLLIVMTLFAIMAQISLFLIHYKVSELLDSFVESSLSSHILHSAILMPLVAFLLIQMASYALVITWLWFITVLTASLFQLSKDTEKYLGLFLWCSCVCAIITFNNYYFTDSFFAVIFRQYGWYDFHINLALLIVSTGILLLFTLVAYIHFFLKKHSIIIGSILLGLICVSFVTQYYEKVFGHSVALTLHKNKPNIIFIGLDSLRPDFIGYFGHRSIYTPNIDSFLQSSTVFTQTYSPLARTFPAWISILTAQHPKNNNARDNLVEPDSIITHDNLAKRLQALGYETTYGTDEKRFSNITHAYGFDHLIGPEIGVNDFILGGLSDFPLSNLLVNTPLGRIILPYNYANRAAAITYNPDTFIDLIERTLHKRHDKPQFVAIHLCLTHWPYTWAHDGQTDDLSPAQRYQSSVEAIDHQLGQLMALLKKEGLLENTAIVLLSDHGTTIGLPGDRIISPVTYQGDKDKLGYISSYQLGIASPNNIDLKKEYTISTSYGQGTDILSLKQHHVLLALHGFGHQDSIHHVDARASLLDVTPTVLDLLHQKKMSHSEGISLMPYVNNTSKPISRPLYLETGFTISVIESKNIFINQVIHNAIGAYDVNPTNGLLVMKPEIEKSLSSSKQRAVLWDDWLLAHYPARTRVKLSIAANKKSQPIFTHYTTPPYYVLVNVKTGKWTIGVSDRFSAQAPTQQLLKLFNQFYGDEI